MKQRPLKVYGYARLSREDMRGLEATEEKLQSRIQMCLNLAAQHDLPLRAEDIFSEVATGTLLSARPRLIELLTLCRQGGVTHLITPYQDRLTRGNDADRGAIKEALCAGKVTLITLEGVMPFDRDFGDRYELLFDIKAAVASHYVRDIVKKRKEADLIRLKEGKRHMVAAPYGYRRVKLRDVLDKVEPPEYLNKIFTVPEEFAILEEIFQRLRTEKAAQIVADLNRRAIPPPSSSRPGVKASEWNIMAVYAFMRNPFYIGRLSQKSRIERGRGKVHLYAEEYILSDVVGDWPCPVSEEEFYRLQSLLEGYRQKASPRRSLLSALLYCSQGEVMRLVASHQYGCECRLRGEKHPGDLIVTSRADGWIKQVVTAFIDGLPDEALPTPKKATQGRKRSLTDLQRARRERTEKEQQAQDLILREVYFVSLMGREVYEATARKTRDELQALQERVTEIESVANKPDAAETLTLLQRIRHLGGMALFWETSSAQEQRAVVERIIKRIDLLPSQKRFVRAAEVTFWEWAEPYAPETLPEFPKITSGTENLRRWLEGKKRGQEELQ